MDNAKTIGELLLHTRVRDAIHVPIISATAAMVLLPGSHVRLTNEIEAILENPRASIGVVDPFLSHPVIAGDRCWILLRPGSISSLTHQWAHEQIPETAPVIPDREMARRRLENWATGELEISLDKMIDAIEGCRDGDDPLYSHSYESIGEYEGFWTDYEIYTGKADPHKEDDTFYFFTCGGC